MINTDKNWSALRYSYYSFELLKLIAKNCKGLEEANAEEDILVAFRDLLLGINDNDENYVDFLFRDYFDMHHIDDPSMMDKLEAAMALLQVKTSDAENLLYVLPEGHALREAIDDNKIMKTYRESCVVKGTLLIVTSDTPNTLLETLS